MLRSGFSIPRTSAARRSFSWKLFPAAKRKLYTSGRAGSIWPDGAAGGRLASLSDATDSLAVCETRGSLSLRVVPVAPSSLSGREGSLRIDGRETGFALSPTRYSSTARLVMPAESRRSFSTFSSLRWGARRPATLRLILPSAMAASTWGKRRATFAT
jgi:hypothetical protein